MYRIILLIVILALASSAISDMASQYTWWGGPGVLGPVTNWGDRFYEAQDCDWTEHSGFLYPATFTLSYRIDDDHNIVDLCSADIDGDGDVDVVGSGWDLNWWENEGGLQDNWPKHTVNEYLYSSLALCCGDMDLDGDMDIICGHSFTLSWFENTDGAGMEWTAHTIGTGMENAVDIQAVDLDNDGDLDIVTAEDEAIFDGVKIWLNVDGSGTSWVQPALPNNITNTGAVQCADMDTDGDMDIVSFQPYDYYLYWWENDGTGQGWIRHTVNDEPIANCITTIHTVDINKDGHMDIVSGENYWFRWWKNLDGTGTAWEYQTIDWSEGHVCELSDGDCDYDGDTDLFVIEYGDGQYSIAWFEKLYGDFAKHVISDPYSSTTIVTADISGNNCSELLTSRYYAYHDIDLWNLNAFMSNGVLTSSILDTGCEPAWETLDCQAEIPDSTSIHFQLRASDDPDFTGVPWSEDLEPPCIIAGVIPDSCSYLQYRVFLETEDPSFGPALSSVSVAWNPLDIQDSPAVPSYIEFPPPYPNPSYGSVTVPFGLPQSSEVSISVHDLTGRVVYLSTNAFLTAGYHSISMDDLMPGIYICRLVSGSFRDFRKLVVSN